MGIEPGSIAEDHRSQALHADMTALAAIADLFTPALARPDRIPPFFRPPGFASLIQLILEQQVSVRAAQAMWRRLTTVIWPVTPDAFFELSDESLKSCGFSGRKIEYARGLAEAVMSGAIDLDALATVPDDEAVATLTALRGIGHWTAECYLLWALGRRDVMPAGDLAIQVGLRELASLAERPDAKKLREAAEAWRPYRSAAALLLWRVYLDNRASNGSTRLIADAPPPTLISTPSPLAGSSS